MKMLFQKRFTHCYSKNDLLTVLCRFLLSFIPFLVLLHSFSKVRISLKVTIACNSFCLLCHTKTWLARDIISYSGTIFSHILACTLLHLEIVALDKNSFCCFWSVICYAKQKHLGCKKNARPIRSHNGYISDQKL